LAEAGAPTSCGSGMLKMNNIEVAYLNVIRVLHGVSLSVDDGQVVALLGANGAGKSTTLKAISGLLSSEEGEVTGGSIEWNGERIDNRSAEEIGKLGVIQALEGRRVFEHLNTEENLLVGAYQRRDCGAVKADLDMVYQYFPRLKEMRRSTAGYLSGGEQQMLVVGRAIMASPKLLMLDEPSLGLAPKVVETIFQVLVDINKKDVTILLIEQNAQMALQVAHRGYVMETGKMSLEGKAEDVAQNEQIKKTYLGL